MNICEQLSALEQELHEAMRQIQRMDEENKSLTNSSVALMRDNSSLTIGKCGSHERQGKLGQAAARG